MKHRILIADDDESGRSGLAALLTMWGYEVQECVDGKDALERAPAFRPSVVIADMIMPVIDGIGLLKPLAAAVPDAAVILLTAHGSIETAVSAMREGAYDYMTKPVDPRRLRVLVEKAVEKVQVNREVTVLRRQLKETRGLGPLLGQGRPHLSDLGRRQAHRCRTRSLQPPGQCRSLSFADRKQRRAADGLVTASQLVDERGRGRTSATDAGEERGELGKLTHRTVGEQQDPPVPRCHRAHCSNP